MNACNMTITPNTYLARCDHLFTSTVDDELVMMDEKTGHYFGLNPIARVIWQTLEHPTKYQQLVQSLTDIYDVSYEACAQDVQPFLQSLLENQLIRIEPAC